MDLCVCHRRQHFAIFETLRKKIDMFEMNISELENRVYENQNQFNITNVLIITIYISYFTRIDLNYT